MYDGVATNEREGSSNDLVGNASTIERLATFGRNTGGRDYGTSLKYNHCLQALGSCQVSQSLSW